MFEIPFKGALRNFWFALGAGRWFMLADSISKLALAAVAPAQKVYYYSLLFINPTAVVIHGGLFADSTIPTSDQI